MTICVILRRVSPEKDATTRIAFGINAESMDEVAAHLEAAFPRQRAASVASLTADQAAERVRQQAAIFTLPPMPPRLPDRRKSPEECARKAAQMREVWAKRKAISNQQLNP